MEVFPMRVYRMQPFLIACVDIHGFGAEIRRTGNMLPVEQSKAIIVGCIHWMIFRSMPWLFTCK
jgi:hypothetical protein